MKHLRYVLIFLLASISTTVYSQKNVFKLGVVNSTSAYLELDGLLGPVLEADASLDSNYGITFSVGWVRSAFGDVVTAFGVDLNYPGKFAYTLENRESTVYSGMSGFYTVIRKGVFSVNTGLGFSILQSTLRTRITTADGNSSIEDYPSYMLVEDNDLVELRSSKSGATVLMGNVFLEPVVRIHKQIQLSLRGVYRTAFTERQPIFQTIDINDGPASITISSRNSIKEHVSLAFAVGYVF